MPAKDMTARRCLQKKTVGKKIQTAKKYAGQRDAG